MRRRNYIGTAFLLSVLSVAGQTMPQRLNAIEKQKMELPALLVVQGQSASLRSSSSPDYTKGTFIVNEDWYGHQNGSVNFLSDDGKWTYNAFQKENPGKQLGCTSQFGTIYGGKLYIVSKQDKDPSASVTGSRLAVINATTMKVEKEFTTIGGADGRSFLGVDEQTGYIGTSNGIWLYHIDKQTIGEQILGTGNSGGSLYSGQIGTMIRVGKYVFAVHQKEGLLVIDAATHQITTTLLKPEDNNGNGLGSIVLSKDGTLWASPTQELSGSGGCIPIIWKVDPSALTATKLAIPTNEGIEEIPNSWYAWTADGFCSSAQENKIYWKGQGSGSWFTGYKIYCYDIDKNSFYKVFDFTKLPDDWRLYGTGFRLDPVSDDMYCFLYHEFLNPEHELAVIATNGRGETNGAVKGRYPYEKANYWFPALPVFPDNEAPVVKSTAPKEVAITQENNHISIPLENIVEDKDNMTAAIVTTITMDDTYKELLTADVQNNRLVIKPSIETITEEVTILLSLKFNSNGKVTHTQLTVQLGAGTTAPFELSAKELLLDKGKTAALTIKGMENETATWTSSDIQIATVSDEGVITAKTSGTVILTATSTTRPGISASCKVTVKREDLVLDASTLDLFDNGQTKLIKVASGFAANTEKLTWSTSDEDIVSIISSNPIQVTIQANAIGTVEITGTISLKNDDQNIPLATAKCIVTVNKLIPVERIELRPVDPGLLDQDTVTVDINKSVSYVATVYPENASIKTVAWSSSNPSSFSVTDGVVTAKGNGSAVITASSSQGGDASIEKSASANVACAFELEKVYFEKRVYGCKQSGVITTNILYEPAKPSNLTVKGALEGQNWKVVVSNNIIKVQPKAAGEGILTCTVTDNSTGNIYTDKCKIIFSNWATSFTLHENNKLLKKDETFQLAYTLDDANLTDDEKATKEIIFSSNNPEVASVSDEGLVTAKKAGKANITVYISDGSYSRDCQVLVGEVWATGVKCEQDTVRVALGEAVQLSATVEPQSVSFPSVTWRSDGSYLASDGLFAVPALGVGIIGKHIARATSLDKQATDSCIVYVVGKTPLTGLSLSPSELSVDINDAKEEAGIIYSNLLKVDFLPGNATLASTVHPKYEGMTSSDESVLKVNKSNLLDYQFKPQKIGTVKVTVIAAENNIQDVVTIHVTDRSTGITGLSLDASSIVEESGKTLTIGHHVSVAQDAEGDIDKTVKWESSNPEIAIVNSSTGEIKTFSEGETVIRATTNKGGFTAICRLAVSKGIAKVTGISLNKESLAMVTGETSMLTATITPENAKTQTVTWNSDNNEVVTVDASGTVTAKTTGEADITVTTLDGGFTATCRVSVSNPIPPVVSVTGVKLDAFALNLKQGGTAVLTAIITPSNAANKAVAWYSSNTAVASVSNDGTVTANIAGTATISVTTDDGGHTATCKVTVTNPDLEKPVIEAKDSTATLTFPKVEEATMYEVSVYKYVNQVPVLFDVYTTDAEGNILTGLKSNLRSGSSAHITISLQQLNRNTEYIVKITAVKEKDGKTETLATFSSEPFTTSDTVGNEQIDLSKCAVSYANQHLHLANLEQFTCYVITMSGNIQKIFNIASPEEKYPLYLPNGVYIITATKDNMRISQKIQVTN